MSEEKGYRFYAFISYSRKNEKAAKWMQKKLELYRLPSALQGQNGSLPKKLKIFRDKTDIGVGGTVERALSRELQDSKKLIVICSPDSAKSDYVEYEISSFLKLGRSPDDILPFVIDGKIDSNSKDNCYAPLLAKLNLNAADATQEGWNNAFIRLLASLLEIKYDDLKQRERARQIRRSFFAAVACFLFLSLATSLSWYFTPHTYFYADCVSSWGIPEGIKDFRLTKKEARSLPAHYEIVKRCFRPIKVSYVNSAGVPVPQNLSVECQNRPSVAIYSYDDPFFPTKNKKAWGLASAIFSYYDDDFFSSVKKTCSVKIHFNKISEDELVADFYYNGQENFEKSLYNDVLSDKCLFFSDVVECYNPDNIAFKTPEQEFFENCGSIYRCRILFDKDGLKKRVEFYNKNNHAVSDKNGITAIENIYDERKRLVSQTYIYSEAAPFSVCVKRITYDSAVASAVSFFSADGKAAQNLSRGYSSCKIKLAETEEGFSYNSDFFDNSEEPCVGTLSDSASVKIEFDKRGFVVGKEFRKIKRQRENLPAFVKQLHFKKKEIIEKETFAVDKKGLPVEVAKYVDDVFDSRYVFKYEDGLCLKSWERLLEDGKAVESVEYFFDGKNCKQIVKKTGQETIVYDYDKYGRILSQTNSLDDGNASVTKISYYGGNKTISHYLNGMYIDKDGFSCARFSYDNDGTLYFVQFFDSKGNKTRSSRLRFSEYVALHSPNALLVYELFKDQNGELTAPDDYAYYEARQNLEDTVLLKGGYYMPDGQLSKSKQIASFDSKELSDGRILLSYYDGDGNIVYEKYASK